MSKTFFLVTTLLLMTSTTHAVQPGILVPAIGILMLPDNALTYDVDARRVADAYRQRFHSSQYQHLIGQSQGQQQADPAKYFQSTFKERTAEVRAINEKIMEFCLAQMDEKHHDDFRRKLSLGLVLGGSIDGFIRLHNLEDRIPIKDYVAAVELRNKLRADQEERVLQAGYHEICDLVLKSRFEVPELVGEQFEGGLTWGEDAARRSSVTIMPGINFSDTFLHLLFRPKVQVDLGLTVEQTKILNEAKPHLLREFAMFEIMDGGAELRGIYARHDAAMRELKSDFHAWEKVFKDALDATNKYLTTEQRLRYRQIVFQHLVFVGNSHAFAFTLAGNNMSLRQLLIESAKLQTAVNVAKHYVRRELQIRDGKEVFSALVPPKRLERILGKISITRTYKEVPGYGGVHSFVDGGELEEIRRRIVKRITQVETPGNPRRSDR